METTRLCPQCQQPLSADAPDGLCPQCLMKAASGPPPSASGDGLLGDIIDIGDPAEVGRKLPQFEILEMLGRGGMGVVYKARQRNLDREVALKILPPLDAQSPDFVARFSREARALAKLNHPNIVNVHDFGETGGLYYILMEYVDGANLRQILQTRRLAPAEALAIVPMICDALEYAHEEGLVHRDIKPENLLIDKKGRVKIADFGLAKLLRREPLDMTLTLSGMALGTLRYMAPEQMDKPETVDHRADLYSLGVVIYEMLTGETPVGRFELPSQKAQVDVRLDEIVLHALEKEPGRRYQHASEVRTDVENVTGKLQVTSDPLRAEAVAPSGPFIQEAGESFPMRYLPRDFMDGALGSAVSVIVACLFWFLPTAGIYLLCSTAGVAIDRSIWVALAAGVVLFLTLAFILASGSVNSISVQRAGLTIHRTIGPSRFLPWSSILQIQAMSRGDAARMIIWPGFPPRGSILGMTTKDFYRIACVDDCWHFGPRDPEKFLEAVRRLRNVAAVTPGAEKRTGVPNSAPTPAPAPAAGSNPGAANTPASASMGQRSRRPRRVLYAVLALLAVAVPFIVGTVLNRPGILDGTIFARREPPIDPPPPLETITAGIGATFTVPAGQVATFEVVTRKNNATVPISGVAAYVLAGSSSPVAGTFRWFPKEEELSDGSLRRRWKIELVTGGGKWPNGSFGGGKNFGDAPEPPKELESAIGARSYNWSPLPADRETIDWAISRETDDLPANGLVGFRVRTQSYEPEPGGTFGAKRGTGNVDWQKGLKMHSIKEDRSLKPGPSAAPVGEVARIDTRLPDAVASNNPPAPPSPPPVHPNTVTYLEGHTSVVQAVAVSPDGHTLVSAGMDGRVIVRDLPSGKLRRIAIDNSHSPSAPFPPLYCAAISPDSRYAAVGGDMRALQSIDLFDNQVQTLHVPNELGLSIRDLMLYDGGAKLAYIGMGVPEIVFFDTGTNRIVAQTKIVPGKFFPHPRTMTASPDGTFVAVTSSEMQPTLGGGSGSTEPFVLAVFDTQGVHRLFWQFDNYTDFAGAQIVFPDARTLAVCLPSGKMQRWTLGGSGQWQPAETVPIAPAHYTTSAASRDGKIIWLGQGNRITGLDSATGNSVASVDLQIGVQMGAGSDFPIAQIAATSEPRTVAAALWDGRVALAKCDPLDGDQKAPGAAEGASSSAAPLQVATVPGSAEIPKQDGNGSATQPASAAAEILRKVSEKYGSLSTFSATGKIVSIQSPASGGVADALEKSFSLNLARPEFYRVQWTYEVKGLGMLSSAAWSAGDGHKISTYGKVTTYLNREQTLAAATGVSGGVAFTVPGLFFKDEGRGLDKLLTNATMLPEESVGADICYVVSGDNHAYKYTLWITKKDLFLKQLRTAHDPISDKGTSPRGEQLTDETLRKIIKMNGQEGTPEEIGKLRKQMESGRQRAEAGQRTSTTTFESIAANDLLIKEDFEFTVPAAVPAQQPPAPAPGAPEEPKKP
jgi:predicted Ser/Thr protein kinase